MSVKPRSADQIRSSQAHLDFCAQLAARIPVKRLLYPHDYAALPRVRNVIQADLAG